MTNGNDILCFMEDNFDTLEDSFLMSFTHDQLKTFILKHDRVINLFRDTHDNEWSNHVEDEFDCHNTGGN